MSFEQPHAINGWAVTGMGDHSALEDTPSLFSAVKGDWRLTIHHNPLTKGMVVKTYPAKAGHVLSEVKGVTDWRLRWNDYDVARGRSIQQILQKATEFMSSK